MGKSKRQPKLGSLQTGEVQAIIKRLKYGRMPRSDTKLGLLLRDVEAGLIRDLGDNPNAGQVLKVGVVLQLVVCIAGLPLFSASSQDVHPAYRWAVDNLRGLLDELYRKPAPPKASKEGQAPMSLEDVLTNA